MTSRDIDVLRRKKACLDELRPLSPKSLEALAAW
jgi:hypothetical protein